jgi:hypothetical protein
VDENIMKHNWFPLMSDINTHWSKTYHWWRCSNCKEETRHTKDNNEPKPLDENCKAKEKESIFPLSSV